MGKPSVLVLGGGVGGVVVSSLLRERLKHRISLLLVERKKTFDFPPSFPWLMLGLRERRDAQRDLSLLTRKKGVDVLNDEVVSIDIEGRSAKTKGGDTLSFDYLVIALGAEYAPGLIPGYAEHAHHIYDLESTLKFREAIKEFAGGTIAIGISRLPIKCPAAPYEVALLLEDFFRKRGVRDRVRFEFFTPEDHPLPAAGPDVGVEVLRLLQSKGIRYHPRSKLVKVGSQEAVLEDGKSIPYDLLFCVPPHTAPKPVAAAGLTDGTGWVPVDPRTLETRYRGVYAIGDVTSIPTPHGYTPYLPKAGVFARGQAEVVASNLAAAIRGRGRARAWDGEGSCFLEVGNGRAAYVKGRFLAEPKPEIQLHRPSRVWHMAKFAFEKYWMRHWF